MKRNTTLLIGFVLMCPLLAQAAMSVKIVQLRGEVKVRRGVEEKWQAAANGMLLEEIDTIMTLEGGEVELELGNRVAFRLGSNAILDIADLREITERELFLILMSQKVGKLSPRPEKIPLRIGEVSAVRGTFFQSADSTPPNAATAWWRMEANAAQALQAQNFLPNAALKLHRLKGKFPQRQDCGEVSFALARAFEALRQPGRARDEYQATLDECKKQSCEDAAAQNRRAETHAALQRLQ